MFLASYHDVEYRHFVVLLCKNKQNTLFSSQEYLYSRATFSMLLMSKHSIYNMQAESLQRLDKSYLRSRERVAF